MLIVLTLAPTSSRWLELVGKCESEQLASLLGKKDITQKINDKWLAIYNMAQSVARNDQRPVMCDNEAAAAPSGSNPAVWKTDIDQRDGQVRTESGKVTEIFILNKDATFIPVVYWEIIWCQAQSEVFPWIASFKPQDNPRRW